MKAVSKTRWCALLLAIAGCWSAVRAQDVVLVANKNVDVAKISAADLRAIFLGEKTRFGDGSRAVPVTLKGGAIHEVFLKRHVGESPDDFRAQWRKAIFTGHGAMPKACESESALIEYVASTPGAVGYVGQISARDKNRVNFFSANK
jgi:ABC-type phosphate transport system substrate-binding protein